MSSNVGTVPASKTARLAMGKRTVPPTTTSSTVSAGKGMYDVHLMDTFDGQI